MLLANHTTMTQKYHFREVFLLQKFYDIVTLHFVDGKIDKNTYFKISEYIESKREIFTVNLN
jgi:hypothetical protein